MTKDFFEEVMRVPTCSQHEDMMQDFLLEWGKGHGCQTRKDGKGNVYLTKGKPGQGQFYPAFLNHIDTVHHDQLTLIERKEFKEIVWEGDKVVAFNPFAEPRGPAKPKGPANPNWIDRIREKDEAEQMELDLGDKREEGGKKADGDGEGGEEKAPEFERRQTGLGADNQCGCAIALAVLDSIPFGKALFVVEEEMGCRGVEAADLSFFDDCAFVFSNDSPEGNRAAHYSAGVQLYSDEFFDACLKKTCADHGLTDFRSEPGTDVKYARKHELPDGKHLECLNFGNGGYNPHRDSEYAKFSEVCNAEDTLRALCGSIPLDKQHSSDIKPEPRQQGTWGGGGAWGGYYGGGYSAWRAGQRRGTDDEWWSALARGRQQAPAPGGRKDFPGREPDERGSFTYKFKKRNFANTAKLALGRLQRTTKPGALGVRPDGPDAIAVEGELLALRYAYMACFNADNQTQWSNWGKFIDATPGAIDAFERIVKFGDEDSAEGDGKMAHGPSDMCSIDVNLLDDEVEDFRKEAGPVEIKEGEGKGAFEMSGRLEDVKRAWAAYCGIAYGSAAGKFSELDDDEQQEFWDGVEFGGGRETAAGKKKASDEIIDVDYVEKPAGNTDSEDFWSWWDSRNKG